MTANKISRLAKKTFLRSLCGHRLASKECDEFFSLIRETRGLMAGFFAPQSPKQQFLIGSLVLSIVAGIGPKLAGSRTMTQPPGTFRVYPSYVVNTGHCHTVLSCWVVRDGASPDRRRRFA
jgi:hypothetical protein